MKKKRFYKVILAFKHDAAISDFKNDYHHGDVDVVGLERCK